MRPTNTDPTVPARELLTHSFGVSVWTVAGDAEPVPLEAHLSRAAAVQAALQPSAHLKAKWGALEASDPPRLVEVIVKVDEAFAPLATAAHHPLRDGLLAEGTKAELATIVAVIADGLRAEQERGRLGRFDIYLADGNRIRCEPGRGPIVAGFRDPEFRKHGRTA